MRLKKNQNAIDAAAASPLCDRRPATSRRQKRSARWAASRVVKASGFSHTPRVQRLAAGLVALAFAALAFAALPVACGGGVGSSSAGDPDGSLDGLTMPETATFTYEHVELDAPEYPDASCVVEIDTPPLMPAQHVPVGTDVQWDSNPPSSGPHFPIWAAYQAYATPVPRGYYVHDEEHGGVVLLYRCEDAGGCPDVAAALQAASDSIPDDPLCAAAGEGVRVRTVITPDPLLDVPVAAAAWGWVYRAQCADQASLNAFAQAHYGQGPEVLCGNGTTQF